MMRFTGRSWRVWLGCGLLLAAGCDKAAENADKAVKKAKAKAGDAARQVSKAPAVRGAEFKLDKAVKVASCYASLRTFSDGRPAAFQVASYAQPKEEKYPSFLYHVAVEAKDLEALAGQTVLGQLYVMPAAAGPAWHSTAPVEFKVTSVENKTLVGEFVAGELVNTKTGSRQAVSGQVGATIR